MIDLADSIVEGKQQAILVDKFIETKLELTLSNETLDLVDKVLAGIFFGSLKISARISNYLLRSISINELHGVHKVLYSIISGYDRLNGGIICKETFDFEQLQLILDNGINKLVSKYDKDFGRWIAEKGLDYTIETSAGLREFTDFLYAEVLSKYREIETFLADSAEVSLMYLAEELKKTAMQQTLMATAEVLSGVVKFKGLCLSGSEDASKILQTALSKSSTKYSMTSAKQRRYEITELTNLEAADIYKKELIAARGGKNNFFEELYDCNFGPLNIQLCRSEVLTIIGDEGIGKTKIIIDQVYYALKQKHNVLFICTETAKFTILNQFYARHIYETTGMQVSEKELQTIEATIANEVDSEKRRRLEEQYCKMQDAIQTFYSGELGTLSLVQSEEYENIYDVAVKYKDKMNGDIIAIDSISFLDANGKVEIKKSLDGLMTDLENLCNDEGLSFILTTHTGSDASKVANKSKANLGVRISADSGNVTKQTTIAIYVYTKPELKAQDLVVFHVKKSRARDCKIDEVILKRFGAVNHYEYDEKYQVSISGTDALSTAQATMEDFMGF